MPATDRRDLPSPENAAGPDHRLPPDGPEPPDDADRSGLVPLIRQLADDTRVLVQQEIELAKMEAAATAKRIAIDSAWVGAGIGVLALGGIVLVLALALALGALLGSYWVGAAITGAVLFLVGALFAWKGIRDLKKGGFAPTGTIGSLQQDKDWARKEVDDLKKSMKKEQP